MPSGAIITAAVRLLPAGR